MHFSVRFQIEALLTVLGPNGVGLHTLIQINLNTQDCAYTWVRGAGLATVSKGGFIKILRLIICKFIKANLELAAAVSLR